MMNMACLMLSACSEILIMIIGLLQVNTLMLHFGHSNSTNSTQCVRMQKCHEVQMHCLKPGVLILCICALKM